MRLLCCLIGFILTCSFASASEQVRQLYHLSKHDLGTERALKAPLKVIKSEKGSMWFFFKDHVLKQDGLDIQTLSFADKIKKNRNFSTQLNVVTTEDGILFSLNKKLFFIHHRFDEVEELPLLVKHNIQGLARTADGNIWINTLAEVYVGVSPHSAFQRVELPDNITRSSSGFPMSLRMIPYGHDKVLISTALSTLFSIQLSDSGAVNAKQYAFDKYHDKGDFFYDIKLYGDLLFIAAERGLYAYDLSSGIQQRLESSFPVDGVRRIAIDGRDIWLAANGQLIKTDVGFSKVEKAIEHSNLAIDLAKTYSWDIYVDDERNVWFSLMKQGLYKYSPSDNKFNLMVLDDAVGIDSRALVRFSQVSNGEYLYITHNSAYLQSQTGDHLDFALKSFVEVGPDDYWLAGYGQIIHIQQGRLVAEHLTPGRYATSMHLSGTTLWYTLNYGGLYSVDLTTQRAKHHINISAVQFLLALNADSQLLSFNQDGIFILDTEGSRASEAPEELVRFNARPIDVQRQNHLVFLFFDDGSVYAFDLQTNVYQRLDFAPVTTRCLIYQQEQNTWWMSQENGDVIRYQHDVKDRRILSQKDGLPLGGADGEFCGEHLGKVVFSTVSGLFKETANIDFNNQLLPKLNVQLQLPNRILSVTDNTLPMEITAKDFPLQFQFSGSSYQRVKQNRLRYQILGFDKQVNTVSMDDAKVTLLVLPVGDYQLSAQISNNDGLYSALEHWRFTVVPPLWLTWWAKSIYIAALVTLLWILYLARTRNIRDKAHRLELLVQEKTEEVTQEKQTVELLLSQKEQEFVHISHELRTPLTLITGPVNLALQKTRNKEIKGYLDMALRSSSRLNRMVDQLLYLERSKFPLEGDKQVQNIAYITKAVCQSFSVYAQRKSLSLTADVADAVYMKFTPDAFEKILVNLLSNAVKYSTSGAEILVKAELCGDKGFALTVKDSGIGIKPDEQLLVFDKFYRAENTQSEKALGAGVGLALVKELVEAHGGEIHLKSALGQGTEVIVSFDKSHLISSASVKVHINESLVEFELTNMDMSQPLAPVESAEPAQENQPTLLIIEDDADMQHYLMTIMTPHFICQVAENGLKGVEKALEILPDFIICDVMMPVMDGFEATKRLKENEITAHIPIVLLTARGDKNSRLSGWKSLADDYIAKPFDADELLLRSQNLLSIRQILRQRFNGQLQQGQPLSDEGENFLNIKDSQFIDKVSQLIIDNLDNENYSVQQLIQALFMSERQLQRKLKALIDFTPREYIQHIRLVKSKALLLEGKSVAQTSELTGFSSPSYFSRCFKAKFNLSPKQFTSKL